MLKYLLLLITLCPIIALSQSRMPCINNPPPEEYVFNVVPLCSGLDGLNQYCFTLQPAPTCGPQASAFPPCNPGQFGLNNPNWFGFVAGANMASLAIEATNCQSMGDQGIQFAVYELAGDLTLNCDVPSLPLIPVLSTPSSPLPLPQCNRLAPNIVAVYEFNTQVGGTYYVVFDGWAGDVCDIFIRVSAGGAPPSVDDPTAINFTPTEFVSPPVGADLDTVCVGAVQYPIITEGVFGASSYIWTLPNGATEVTFDTVLLYNIPPGAMPGDIFEFCVQARSDCDTSLNDFCEMMVIAPLDTVYLPPIFLCEGESTAWPGGIIGPYENLTSDLVVNLTEMANNPTFFECTYVVSVEVFVQNENDEAPNPIDTVICDGPPLSFTIFGTEFTAATEDFLIPDMGGASNDCDTFYSLTVDFIFAELTFDPNDAICTMGDIQVCPSNANYLPAPGTAGLSITYEWIRVSDGASVSDAMECLNVTLGDFTQDVETFRLSITMTKDGLPTVPCEYGPFDVQIDRTDLLPTEGVITGPSEVCVDEIVTYMFATADPDNPDPTWSTIGDVNELFSDFSIFQLQFNQPGVAWVCVTPTNACGPGDSTCFQLEVFAQPDAGSDAFACDTSYQLQAVSPATGFWFVSDSPNTSAIATFSDRTDPNAIVAVNDTGTWIFAWSLTSGGCFGEIAITFVDSMTIDGAEAYICDNTNTNYVIEFDIQGGLAPFTVVSGNGSVTGNSFTSDDIPNNTAFTVVIQDAAGCQAEFTFEPYLCSCDTEAGTMETTLLSSCGASCLQAVSNFDTMMDANDVAQYILHDQAGPTISNAIARNDTGAFCFIPGVTDFDVTYYISMVVGDSMPDGSVNLMEGCTRVAPGQPVIWYEIPNAVAAVSNATCSDSIALQATVSVGVGSWYFVSGPGTLTFADANNFRTIAYSSTCGNYVIGWTEDNNGCRDSVEVTARFLCGPEVAIIATPCNGTQTEIDLTITLQNGVQPYMERNDRGMIAGAVFTIDSLPLNTPDTFYFEDNNGCELVVIVPIGDCSCITQAGTMALTLISDCQDQSLTFVHDATGVDLDANDSLRFFVHDRTDDTLGVIIATSSSPTFSFTDGPFECDTTYYVSAVAGNWNGTIIDQADPCLIVSPGQPLRFDCSVSVDAGMDVTDCGPMVDLIGVSSTGAGVWTAITAGATITGIDNLTGRATLPGPGLYTFEFAANNGQCVDADQVVITVPDAPIIDTASVDIQCNMDNDMYTVSFIISGGDQATYTIVGSTTGTQTGNTFTSDLITSGSAYSFQVFDVNDCSRDDIMDSFTCACLSAAGTMNGPDLNLCEEVAFDASAVYNQDNSEDTDGNDVVNYILSDNQANPTANILVANVNGVFSFDGTTMTFGTTYYIAVIVGNGSSPTTVDLGDPCLSTSTVIAVTWYDRIDQFTITASNPEITCQNPEVTLMLTTAEDVTGYELLWTTGNGSIVPGDETLPNARVTTAGTYILTISHPLADCEESEVIVITQAADVPVVMVDAPTLLTCATTQATVLGQGSTAGMNISYEWSGPGIVGGNTSIDITANVEGVYTLIVRDAANGCESMASTTLMADRNIPVVIATAAERLDCDSDQVTVSGLGSMEGVNVVYTWVVVGSGNIVSGADQRDIVVDAPGMYELNVLNTDNGCSDVVQVEVIQEADIITSFDTEVQPSGCAGVDDGTIGVVNIIGGVPPYSYSFDGGITFSANASQGSFGPGIYDVVVRDNNGCEVEGIATLAAPFDFFVDLGEDQIIELGTSLTLEAITNLPDNLTNTIRWSPLFDTLNQDNLTQTFRPAAGQYSIVLAITNTNGCIQQDIVNVFVRFEERVYVPNALHIDGPISDNRYLNIYADPASVASISSFQIYDRWGNRVFDRSNVPVQLTLNRDYAWDGSVKGEDVEQGVYSYVIQLEYVTGVTDVLSGNVTVLQ